MKVSGIINAFENDQVKDNKLYDQEGDLPEFTDSSKTTNRVSDEPETILVFLDQMTSSSNEEARQLPEKQSIRHIFNLENQSSEYQAASYANYRYGHPGSSKPLGKIK